MCFELGSCFGKGRSEDFGGERSKTARAGRRKADRRNGYYSGTDHSKAPAPAPAPAYPHQPHGATAVDEPGHMAYDGGHGGYAQDKQAGNDTPKLPAACHNKLGDDAGYTYGQSATRRASTKPLLIIERTPHCITTKLCVGNGRFLYKSGFV